MQRYNVETVNCWENIPAMPWTIFSKIVKIFILYSTFVKQLFFLISKKYF